MYDNYLLIIFLGILISFDNIDGRSILFERAKGTKNGCSINLNGDLSKKNEPLFFIRTNKIVKLAMPETFGKDGSINLKTGQELLIGCVGKKNSLAINNKEFTNAVCKKDNIVTIGKTDYKVEDLQCHNRIAATVQNTDKSCAKGNGKLLQLGFEVDGWHSLVESCHDIENSQTFYSTHTVYGTSLAGKVIQSYRPGFSRGDKQYYKGFNPDKAYSQENQLDAFRAILGNKKGEDYLKNEKIFLARGHLAPDADFLFGAWQMLTYFYVNTAPQWQSINAGGWLAVENNVRKLAINLGEDLEVITGTHGILELEDGKGEKREIYLEGEDKLPVPDYFWKIIRNPTDSSCLAIISTNNPFLKKAPKPICKDITSKINWPIQQKELEKGFMYGCEIEDFKKTVKYIPDIKCKSLLKFV